MASIPEARGIAWKQSAAVGGLLRSAGNEEKGYALWLLHQNPLKAPFVIKQLFF